VAGGLDLDGLVAIRARQPKTKSVCQSAFG
jgi:hypothetical protein